MENDRHGSGLFGAFILGGIIGAIIAFLLSHRGSHESLREKFNGFTAQAKQTIKEAIEEGKEAAMRKEAELRGELDKEDE